MGNIKYASDQPYINPILQEIMPQGVATLNDEGVILYCNPSFAQMVNLQAEQVTGTKFENYIAESSKEHFKKLFKQSWSEPIKDEIHLNDHKSIVMPVLLTATTFEQENSKLLSIILTDISSHNRNQNELKKRTEELEKNLLQLKESEERFRLIVENVKDYSIVMLDPDGNVITWNKGVERIKGYKANEIIGKHISVVYTPEEILNKEPEHNLKMAKQLGRYESEGWRVRKDGSLFFADVIITALYDEDNNFQGYAKITRDDTERNKSQNDLQYRTKQLTKKVVELRESEERFRLIVENVKDYSIIMLDADGNIKTWNKGAEGIKGYKANEIIGKHISVVYTPEEIERKEPEHNLKMAKELGRYESEGWRVRKDGSTFFADVIITAIYDADNNFQGYAKITRDVTERNKSQSELKKRTEELEKKLGELQESEERFRLIVENVKDYSIVMLDADGFIKTWNKGAERIKGYKANEIIGKHISVVYTPEEIQRKEPEHNLEMAKEMGRYESEGWRVRKDGSTFFADVIITAIYDADNKFQGYAKITRDVTARNKSESDLKNRTKELEINLAENERKATELSVINKELLFQIDEKEKKGAQLTTANTFLKEKEELIAHKDSILAILSHDLRAPLAGIIGASEYLQNNVDDMDPTEVKELLALLHDSSTKELYMLDYLVEWARIKYASEVFSPEEIELTSCVDKVFDLLNEAAAKNEVKLHNEVEKHISVWADRKMILSILQNLLSNAIKHSIPCEVISVSAKKEENELIVQVKDNGIGMNKETCEKLFTPQMDSLSKGREGDKGAGIGLLLVKGFLEKNGGRIWVESEEAIGTTFYFTLPITKPVDILVS